MTRATIPIRPAHAPSGALDYFTTKKDEFVGWARKFSLFPYPFVTACCAMEFMAVSSTPYDTDRFGAALPRFSPRQSDLLMVVGTVTHKQAPILLKVYAQMCEPKWVMAFGACATSGGFYQNYAARCRDRQDHPGGRLRTGLSAATGNGHRRDHAAAGPDRTRAPPDHHRELLIMAAAIMDLLQRELVPAGGEASLSHGMLVLTVPPAAVLGSVRRLATEFGFDLFLDVTAVDWPQRTPRFDVVYHFYSTAHRMRVRLKTGVPEAEPIG